VSGKVEREDFVVENLSFQSSPGLYVTGNLYLPKRRVGKVPAILYVCGHGRVQIDGISYGNKVHYQHHGIWFARNGFACLVIDTLQLGEIEGIHHGTYSHDRWWWQARGYTPAGVEAWNCVRALDYLQSREEVDGGRLGVTGRSGGGAYSWWIAAIDERIKAAVPVAGITSLRNHVVDGCVEGHCDCMFHLNTHRWDFDRIAALVAPRPLLISNTDKDSIFPLDGVYEVYRPVRRLYELAGAAGRLGLNIEEGPHKDTQPLRVSAFHWMNRHLKGAEVSDTFEMAAVKMIDPKELKVFGD
jgi:dienelactone hydrolase